VLHAGLAYKPGSNKAKLVTEGTRLMMEFCDEHSIRYDICGKMIVATSAEELTRLEPLRAQGEANGLQGLRIVSHAEAREHESHVGGIGALLVPQEGIVDYGGVGQALVNSIRQAGGQVVTDAKVNAIAGYAGGWRISTTAGEFGASYLINCAGLHSDRICAMAGQRPSVRIVPFRGEYYRLRADRASLVRGLIYPMADPKFPFLGVHLTRRVDGNVDAGPNAVLALAREGYDWKTINLRDSVNAVTFPGLWKFIARHPRQSWDEIRRSFRKGLFVRALQALVPELVDEDLIDGSAGVRAQAMARDGTLVQDFVFEEGPRALHVLNAPSPAATASIAIGRMIAQRAVESA
jgi:L-2-hydroxyglutarate oxidase